MTLEVQSAMEKDIALLLDWHERDQSSRILRAGAASVAIHIIAATFLLTAPVSWTSAPAAEQAQVRRSVTPLVAPRFELTQKAPNTREIAKEVDLESLRPRPRIEAPRAAPKSFALPAPAPPAPKPMAPVPVPEPPKLEVAQQRTVPNLVQSGIPDAPPPQIQPEAKPKLAFETPGAPGGAPSGSRSGALGRIAAPRAGIDEAVRNVARGGGQGGLIVGDVAELTGPMSPGMIANPTQGRIGSSLELLSDPQGIDFKPYLITVLSAVRRNWFAVIPESAKLGRRGKVIIQFSIDRRGNVPKLVIAMPSGAEALDRAAVAGVSASNPFPPLPAEFRGEQIRLQFSFLYNMAPR